MRKELEDVLVMRIMGNTNRLNILRIIYNADTDLCVNQISDLANISQSLTSHQLAYLSAHGVVEGHRMGQTMCYVPSNNSLSKKIHRILTILSED
jgi:DNA-binding transcriptional ArsR family regulator